MKNSFRLIYLVCFICCFSFFYSNNSLAGIDLPWSTTFDCDCDPGTPGDQDWMQYSDPLTCDGLQPALSNQTANGNWEHIYATANYPGGGGGKGQRHWLGDGGVPDCSGGIGLVFNSNQTNFWMRWYMRFKGGNLGTFSVFKVLYLWEQGGQGAVFHLQYPSDGGINLYSTYDHYNCSQCGWGYGFYPTGISDESWHCFEIHLDIPGGGFQCWLDGALVVNKSNVNYNYISYISQITIGSNCKNVSDPNDLWVDYDDIAVSNTGYIGPIPGTTPPRPPKNLRIK